MGPSVSTATPSSWTPSSSSSPVSRQSWPGGPPTEITHTATTADGKTCTDSSGTGGGVDHLTKELLRGQCDVRTGGGPVPEAGGVKGGAACVRSDGRHSHGLPKQETFTDVTAVVPQYCGSRYVGGRIGVVKAAGKVFKDKDAGSGTRHENGDRGRAGVGNVTP